MSKTKVNVDVMVDVARGYIDGTGLELAIVVWRPGFVERGDAVAYSSTSKESRQVADALMAAVDVAVGDMKVDS